MCGRTGITEKGYLIASDSPIRSHSELLSRFIFISVTCSVIPLLLVGWVPHIYYFRFSLSRAADYFKGKVEYNRRIVQGFFEEVLRTTVITHRWNREYRKRKFSSTEFHQPNLLYSGLELIELIAHGAIKC